MERFTCRSNFAVSSIVARRASAWIVFESDAGRVAKATA
jgi:hypothetical protein